MSVWQHGHVTALDDLWLPYTFDLCSYHALSNADLKGHIDRVGVPFYVAEGQEFLRHEAAMKSCLPNRGYLCFQSDHHTLSLKKS